VTTVAVAVAVRQSGFVGMAARWALGLLPGFAVGMAVGR